METEQVIVVVELSVDRDERHSRVWKRLDGTRLERLQELPRLMLGAGNLLEIALDGEPRELRIEALRWSQSKQMARVLTVPSAPMAESLKRRGLRSRLPWKAKRVATEFLARCRATGWRIAGNAEEPPAPPPRSQTPKAPAARPPSERQEPTL